MTCVSPLRKKVIVKDAFGNNIDRVFDFSCGKCVFCKKKKMYDLTTRLMIEKKVSKYSYFVTLTYSDENLNLNDNGTPELSVRDVQLFFKRLRKKFKVRYYAIGEYGTVTLRPHYHIILFSDKEVNYLLIEELWKKGNINVGYVSIASIKYVAKYHTVVNKNDSGVKKQFALYSRRPGIGSFYVKQSNIDWHQSDIDRNWTVINGEKRYLPQYLLKGLYSIDQRMNNYLKNQKEIERNSNHFESNFLQIVSREENSLKKLSKNKL